MKSGERSVLLAFAIFRAHSALVRSCTYHEDGRLVRLAISIGLRRILSALNLSQFYIDLTGRARADSVEEFTLNKPVHSSKYFVF